jgi:hypothetical protein
MISRAGIDREYTGLGLQGDKIGGWRTWVDAGSVGHVAASATPENSELVS